MPKPALRDALRADGEFIAVGDEQLCIADWVARYMEEHHGGEDHTDWNGHYYRLIRAIKKRVIGDSPCRAETTKRPLDRFGEDLFDTERHRRNRVIRERVRQVG